jgi:hypothetical protein
MTRVIDSTYAEGPQQADGRRFVAERHTTDEGSVLTFEWLGTQDAQMVVEARAAALNEQYAARDAAAALVAGTKIPLSKLEFRNLFGAKKVAVDAFNAEFESHPSLTAEQKAAIRTGLLDFAQAQYIRRPFEPAVVQMISLYQALGLLTAEEAAGVLADG